LVPVLKLKLLWDGTLMRSATGSDACGRLQCLDLLRGHIWVGGVEIQRMHEMRRGPFQERVRVVGGRRGRRILRMPEDGRIVKRE